MAEVVVYVYRTVYSCQCLFRKVKQFHSSKVFFQKRFSSSDHLNVITTNINIRSYFIYFDYIVAKTRRKKVTIKNILTVARVPADIGKNINSCICLRNSSQIAS